MYNCQQAKNTKIEGRAKTMKKLATAHYRNVSALYADNANFTTFEGLATSTTLTAMEYGSTHIKIGVKKFERVGKFELTETVHDAMRYPVELFNEDFIINWRLVLAGLIDNTDNVTMYDVIVTHYKSEA